MCVVWSAIIIYHGWSSWFCKAHTEKTHRSSRSICSALITKAVQVCAFEASIFKLKVSFTNVHVHELGNMARHGDTRSPSPVGSSYSLSKRSRRPDDHYERSKRGDERSRRYRSRSRSPDVRPATRFTYQYITDFSHLQKRYRDRDDNKHRDRSSDRRHDDTYRSSRREKSRDRRRSRDRDRVKDYRNRSRDRDYRDRRDTSRDYDRRRRDSSTDSKVNGRRKDNIERRPSRDKVRDKIEVRFVPQESSRL